MANASEPTVSDFNEHDSDFQLSALVQSFPCIWDTDHAQYRLPGARDEAWKQIALDMDDGRSADEQRQRWRRIRDKYATYLRECSLPYRVPPYCHLSKALEFLKPYIKPRFRKSQKLYVIDQESNGGDEEETIAISDDDCELVEETTNGEWATSTSQNGHNGGTETNFADEEEASGTGRFISVDARNEDAMFLLSVLPNMRQMSAERKKLFKVSLLETCEQILALGW